MLADSETINGKPAIEWIAKTVAELEAMPDVRLLKRSTVFGYHDGNFTTIAQRLTDHIALADRGVNAAREKLWRVRAKQVVLATGAHERPIIFGNNDRPGVMLASAVTSYLNRYAVNLANKAVVFTNNDSAYQVALDAAAAGATVTAVDTRRNVSAELKSKLEQNEIRLFEGHAISSVQGSKGCLLYTSDAADE